MVCLLVTWLVGLFGNILEDCPMCWHSGHQGPEKDFGLFSWPGTEVPSPQESCCRAVLSLSKAIVSWISSIDDISQCPQLIPSSIIFLSLHLLPLICPVMIFSNTAYLIFWPKNSLFLNIMFYFHLLLKATIFVTLSMVFSAFVLGTTSPLLWYSHISRMNHISASSKFFLICLFTFQDSVEHSQMV